MSFSLDRYGHLFPEADEEVALRLDVLRGLPSTVQRAIGISVSSGF